MRYHTAAEATRAMRRGKLNWKRVLLAVVSAGTPLEAQRAREAWDKFGRLDLKKGGYKWTYSA